VICPNCGTDNRVGAKFCMDRELPEAAAATEAARATFGRLGARPLVERLDAATALAVRAPSEVTG
jgi:hypothetical protein